MKKNPNQKKASFIREQNLFELQLMEDFTGKPIDMVLNESSVVELIRLSGYVSFMKHV